MTKRLRIVIAIACVSGSVAGRADAQTAARPAPTSEVHSQLGASINNAGLQQAFDAAWRKPLSASTSVLLSESHLAFGGTIAATPASLRGGAWLEVAPVSFFVVRAGVDPSRYFGTFDSLTSFDNRTDTFDPDARKARHSALSGRTTKFYVTPTIQFRAGPFAGQTSLDIEHWSSSAPGPLFYEPTRDTLLEVAGDRLTTLSTAVLYEHVRPGGGKFSAGPMHWLMRVHRGNLNQVQRLGVVLIQQASGRRFGLSRPRATLVVARYLDDRSKRGQWNAMAAIGFTIKRK